MSTANKTSFGTFRKFVKNKTCNWGLCQIFHSSLSDLIEESNNYKFTVSEASEGDTCFIHLSFISLGSENIGCVKYDSQSTYTIQGEVLGRPYSYLPNKRVLLVNGEKKHLNKEDGKN